MTGHGKGTFNDSEVLFQKEVRGGSRAGPEGVHGGPGSRGGGRVPSLLRSCNQHSVQQVPVGQNGSNYDTHHLPCSSFASVHQSCLESNCHAGTMRVRQTEGFR